MEYRTLGKDGPSVSEVGLGTWSWGSTTYWQYGKGYGRRDIEETVNRAVELGINFLDTAEVYGLGESERLIGDIVPRDQFVIATKYLPLHLIPSTVYSHAIRSLERMGIRYVDLYQVHFRNPLLSLRATMRDLERLVRDGKIGQIGVSNFDVDTLDKARSYLSRTDVASNQVRYNLLHRVPEENGMLSYCQKERVSLIAWSPLEQGVLTGKYKPGDKVGGLRRSNRYFRRSRLEAAQPLLKALEQASAAHGKDVAQGALAWLLREPQVLVIPGAKNVKQLEANAGASGWSFMRKELDALDRAYEMAEF
ncbi:MAG TPA: aldo/keto reductase [Methanomassiliicoccales archaeon]|nr:aldo/keto reductase [Methanomassiliicoccales archaeon]